MHKKYSFLPFFFSFSFIFFIRRKKGEGKMEKEKIRGREERLGGARMLKKEELREGMWVWNDSELLGTSAQRAYEPSI